MKYFLAKQTLFFVVFCFSLFYSEILKSQVNANFSSNTTEGCSPLIVNFNDLSSGNIIDYQWKFGNNNSSDTSSPSATYISPGSYTVTLIVYGTGGQIDSIVRQNYITVFANPVVNFSASRTTSCLPATIDFSDLTVPGSGQITNWQWDFGDGSSSNQPNPSHTYQGLGSYTVSLQVTDANGCSHFLFKDDYINIVNPPNASFTANNRTGCNAPHTVNFTNNSSGTAPFSYNWDFGDGNTSTQENPSHTYNSNGTYTVKLILSDQSGCVDSMVLNNYISINSPTTQIGVNTNFGCTNPATFFQFTNQSSGPQGYVLWNFGDNSIAQTQNPTHVYNTPGIYTVTLITGNSTCRDTATEEIFVQQLAADFEMDKRLACEPPLNVNFTDLSDNAVSWIWSFGDGNTSNVQNPSNTYTQEDSFTITLTVTDTVGCVSSHSDLAIIDIPELSIDALILDYCIPVNAFFTAILNSADPAQSYSWDFGDGGTSTAPIPQYTYTDTGEFVVSLEITTQLGCVVTDTTTVEIGDKPTIFDASFVEDSVCRREGTTLNISSDFAENFIGQVPGDEQDPAIIVDSSVSTTGSKGFIYTPIKIRGVFHNCISDEFTFNDTLRLYGPFCANIFTNINCDSLYTVHFSHDGVGYQLAHWDFGNGTTSDKNFPSCSYAGRGSYDVTLTLIDTITGCNFEKETTVNITDPIAKYTITDSTGCSPFQFIVKDDSSQDATGFSWTSNNPNLNFSGTGPDTFTIAPGDYYLSLIVSDDNGCKDTTTKNIIAYKHENQINTTSTSGCLPVTLDASANVTADTSIASYSWNIGGTNYQDSVISHVFNSAGSYSVNLTTTDYFGCSFTSSIQFIAADPQASFVPNKQLACIGENVTFVNTSTPSVGLDYEWNFGDGNTSTQRIPSHQYSYNDTFTVSLVITDQYGCKDTMVRPNIVRIFSPVADFSESDTSAPCPPLFVDFTDQSSDDVISWSWRFGDNSGSVLQDPGHSYNKPGTFDVQLIVTNNAGCKDTMTKAELINIGGPTGNFMINPPEGCRPLTSRFNIVNANDVAQITWDFGDGFSANGDTVSHTYTSSGIYYPNVVLLNDNNCSFSYERIDTVIVDTLIAEFSTNVTEACIPASLSAIDLSEGNVVNWTWFVDSNTYSGQSFPSQVFTEEGTYNLKLVVENQRGCLDSINKTFTAHPLPFVEISGDSFFCYSQSRQLFATEDSNYTYKWIPEIGLDDPNSSSPNATLEESISYSVIVTDQNSCNDTSEFHDIYVFPELQAVAEPDTTIVIGDTAFLRSSFNLPVTGYQWTPSSSLSCDDCPNPSAFPLETTTYSLLVEDTVGCTEKTTMVEVIVIDDIKIAMPEVFTPNSDDVNDLLFVKGWNIKELIYFKIFNRWGELIFETEDINEGWDGTYKGQAQNMDSYAYVIKALSYTDREAEARGSFSLIR